ncbi:DUF6508 domain-containing protein [Psychroserpens sp. S379A]|uniref:DUF6508 domain-containing protein n=1 Tax=Psychroserpens sp. S379A TaxID=3415137 RepID=UPI003C7E59FA
MIELEHFEKHLTNLSKEEWNYLFDLLTEIKKTKVFGELIESKIKDDGSYSFPYWKSTEIVHKTFETITLLELAPAFDWMNWENGKEILNDYEYDYSELDIIVLCKLLTCVIRLDRFNDGYLIKSFNNHTIQKILTSLKSKVEEKGIINSESVNRKFLMWKQFKNK